MSINVGIVGIGPVGENLYRCLHELNVDYDQLRVLATRERTEYVDDQPVEVQGLGTEYSDEGLQLFEDLDVVFFAGREGEKGASQTWAQPAIDNFGCYCIDNGSDFRLTDGVPLIVPEINMDAASEDTKLIASPNCSTIQMCVALAPLHEIAPVRRVIVSSYQSVSGYGRKAQDDMIDQVKQIDPDDLGKWLDYDPTIFRKPIIFDCLPHIDSYMDNGYTKEELKMLYETRKIFGDDEMAVTATCVRVPVEIGHSEAITAEFDGPMDAETALATWRESAEEYGIVVIDDPAEEDPDWPYASPPKDGTWAGHEYAPERTYPSAADILKDEYKNKVVVGRTRDDYTKDNSINFMCVADNLRKGAATNVIQIAIGLIKRGLLGP